MSRTRRPLLFENGNQGWTQQGGIMLRSSTDDELYNEYGVFIYGKRISRFKMANPTIKISTHLQVLQAGYQKTLPQYRIYKRDCTMSYPEAIQLHRLLKLEIFLVLVDRRIDLDFAFEAMQYF